MSNVTKYRVVIQINATYEVEATDKEDAEDKAWELFDYGDLDEAVVADVSEVGND
jgi:hypothetical protein